MLRPKAPMQKRKYEVSGTDDLSDVHTFATDDRERAEEVKATFAPALDCFGLRPGFCGVSRRPVRRPSSSTNAALPEGRPVRCCASIAASASPGRSPRNNASSLSAAMRSPGASA